MIVIKDLEEMEKIVSHSDNLEWDGWDVVAYVKKTSFFNPLARKRGEEWWETKTYRLGSKGWEVPRTLIYAMER